MAIMDEPVIAPTVTKVFRTRSRYPAAIHYTLCYKQMFGLPLDLAFIEYLWVHCHVRDDRLPLILRYAKLRHSFFDTDS